MPKTDGLVDVIGVLPTVQIVDGVDARVLSPALPDIRCGVADAQVVLRCNTFIGHITLLFGHYNGAGIYLTDTPHLCDRPRSPYHDTNLFAYIDNVLRFALLGWVGAEMVSGPDPFWRPDVVHAHDWHADLAPAYLAACERPAKSVFIVRNLTYQSMFYAHHMSDIQLSWLSSNIHGSEFSGQISLLKTGLYYADRITVVGPTHACKITESQLACGMEGLLQQRHREGRLPGVLNGMDEKIRSPETDLLLASRHTHGTLEDKVENERQLQIAIGLKVDDKVLLFAVVSCLTSQKGLDSVLEVLPGLLGRGGRPALLGAGDLVLQGGLSAAATEYSGQAGVRIGYHKVSSHRIMGGANVALVPSRSESCGLTQLYGLKCGTLPLVRHTGGLTDTVPDCSLENLADGVASRFAFEDNNAWSLLRTIRHAFVLWSRPLL